MAGMFFSLEEAAQRLNKTEDEVRQLVQAGKLREFRDGPNLLFKVDEVEALLSDPAISAGQAAPQPPAPEPEVPEAEVPLDLEIPAEQSAEPEPQPPEPELELPPDLEQAEAGSAGPEAPAEPQAELELDLPPEQAEPEPELPELEIPEAEEPAPGPQAEAPEQQGPEPPGGTSEILLAPETGVSVPPSELTNADTAITGEGISVLGETDKDYAITDDTLSETIGSLGATGTGPEAALDDIEGDVNLDSFGSGSGLLDLSLQADDTSLGGILDEIYTADEAGAEPAEAGTVEEVVAEADNIEASLGAPQVAPEMALVPGYFEPPLDKGGRILTFLMILPGLMLTYAIIVAFFGVYGLAPPLPAAIRGFFPYIVLALVVVGGAVGVLALMADREAKPAAKKAKKPKAKKAKKEKKPRKAAKSKK